MTARRSQPLPASITATLRKGADAQARVDEKVAALADELRAIHGGEWLAIVNHESRAVILYAERG